MNPCRKILKHASNFPWKLNNIGFNPMNLLLWKTQGKVWLFSLLQWKPMSFPQQQYFKRPFQNTIFFITVFLCFITNIKVSATLNDGLVAYYPFEGSAQDASGNNHHGTGQGGVSYTVGKIGQGMSFDGIDDMMAATLPEVKRTYTVSLFAKFNNNDGENQLFYLTRNGYTDRLGYLSTWPPTERSWHFGSRRYEQGWEDRGTVEKDQEGLLDNTWYHLVFILNDNQISLYVNGKLLKTITSVYSSDIEQHKDLLLLIGGSTEVAHRMNGIIDEVHFYNRVLSESEIQSLYTGKGVCPTLLLNKTGTGTGEISSVPISTDCGVDGTEEYLPGTTINLIATPDAPSSFAGWTGTSCANSFTITTDMNCTATFELLPPPKLTVNKIGNGTGTIRSTAGLGSGINCGTVCEESYPLGSTVTLIATPNVHSTFVGWSGTGCAESLIITNDMNCTATFNQASIISPPTSLILPSTPTLGVTIEGTGEGSVTSQEKNIHCTKTSGPCQATYNTGSTVILTPTPASGSYFSSWGGNEDCIDNQIQMFGNQFCVAYFRKLPELTVSKSGTGKGTVMGQGIDCGADCTEYYPVDAQVTLIPQAISGSYFSHWEGDCLEGAVQMSKNKSCVAFFEPLPKLTVEKVGGGEGIITGQGIDCGDDCVESYPINTLVTLTATPAQGSVLKEWSGTCSGLSPTITVMIDMTKTCQATFLPPLVLPTINIDSMPLKLSSHRQTKKLRFMAPEENFSSSASQRDVAKLRSAQRTTSNLHSLVDGSSSPSSVAIPQPPGLPPSATPEVAARHFLKIHGNSFGVDSTTQLQLMREQILPRNRSVVRFQQAYQSIPVLGGETIVNMDAAKNVMSVSGEISPSVQNLEMTPTLSTSKARDIALAKVVRDYQVEEDKLSTNEPQLWIYSPAILGTSGPQINAVVWRVEVTSISSEPVPIREIILVEAHLGIVVFSYSEIYHAKNRIIYDNQNLVFSEGVTPSYTGGVADVIQAFTYSGDTYDFYKDKHARDSLDGSDMCIISIVRYPNFQNALWNGSQVLYGEGFALADDVVGHELTHGVTQYTSRLFYFYQSGAINESFSDLWGEFIDQTNGLGNDEDSVKWKIGEDLPKSILNGGLALRDMKSPTVPDMTSYTCSQQTSLSHREDDDAGDVHTNSGINNKAVYLMTDGGTFNEKAVLGLDMDKVAKLYYEVQTNLLTSAADYADLYDALLQACVNLQYSAIDCQQVKNALDAVKMNTQPTQCLPNEAPICDGPNDIAVDIFFDDFESDNNTRWTIGGKPDGNVVDLWQDEKPVAAWFIQQKLAPSSIRIGKEGYAASGFGNAWGFDQGGPSFGGASDTFLAMNPLKDNNGDDIKLPSKAFMHFKYSYGFDSDLSGQTFYDGGVLEYTTDGGSTWIDAGSLIIENGYGSNNTLASTGNPLYGRKAFGADSRGYTSSRLCLNSLAGKSVRFRFRIGTNQESYDYGWFIDDVRIYTCKSVTDICSTAISWNGQSAKDAVVKVDKADILKIAGSTTPIEVKVLCNYGTIQETAGNLLHIQVNPTTGFIYNEGSILGKDGKSSTDQSTIPTSLVNEGGQGSSIKLNAGAQLYNKGSIKAGIGGAGYLNGGNGGSVTLYADRIIQDGIISAGKGGEGNAHQPAWDGFGDRFGDSTNMPKYGNKPVQGGKGGRTVLQARTSLDVTATSATTLSGTGGNAYVWCVNGAHLTDWESDGRWYTGTCISETNLPIAIPIPGEGGDLIKLSPALNNMSKESSGRGLYYEPRTIRMGPDTHLEAKEDIFIFGGDDWVLDLRNLSLGAISTPRNITLAVGTGSTIDLRGNSSKIFKAGGQFIVYTDTLLLDEGVSLTDLVEAQGGIITYPSEILHLVVLSGPGQVTAEPNTILPIEFELINGGPEADVYNLTISDSAGWNLATLPSSVSLEGLEREMLIFNVTLPTMRGEKDMITVTATSLADPTASAKTEINVLVNPSPPQLFPSSEISPATGGEVTNENSNQVGTTISQGTENSTPQIGHKIGEINNGGAQQPDASVENQAHVVEVPISDSLQGMDGMGFPGTVIGELPLEIPPEPVQIPICPTEGFIDWTCNAQGQILHDLTIGKWGNISNGYLLGTLNSQGWISNLTVDTQGVLNGGMVTGYILNQGTLADITFVGAMLQGGILAGTILNESQVGGTLIDVTLAPHAHLQGGKLQGKVQGDKEAPALLENIRVLKGSVLSGVTLGKGVILEEKVTLE